MNLPDIWPIVIAWGKGQAPSPGEWQSLIDWELSVRPDGHQRSTVWNVDLESVRAALSERARILQALHRHQTVLPLPSAWPAHIELLWTFWLPFAQQIDARQKALGQPFIQGVLGGQGTGKTTLTKGLTVILQQMGQSAATLSLDDLYLSYRDRLKLQQADPRLVWRGPPGTHDINLGVQTLSEVKSASPSAQVKLPQFDKSLHQGQGDRLRSISMPAPSILFFEGWFVGVAPQDDALFADSEAALPAPIETIEDRQFARDMNRNLRAYQPLWALIDSLAVILPEDYQLSYQWRLQAERQMRAAGKESLSDREIVDFVTYFWKALHPELFILPTAGQAAQQRSAASIEQCRINLVVKIGQRHDIKALHSP